MSGWIREGWETYQDEVLHRGWPQHEVLQTLIELTWYGGASWLMDILREEGATPATLERIAAELREFNERTEQRVTQLERDQEPYIHD